MSIMMNTLFGLLCMSAVMINAQSDQDLTFPMTQPTSWKDFGSTIYTTTGAVLTTQRGMPGSIQRGAIWNQKPFPYSKSWEVILKMKISGRNADGGAEGMALWLTENPNELGSDATGSVMGSRDRFRGLGILFDSLDNDKLRNNPSISAHYFNGSQAYGHDDDGLRTQLAGCIADYRNRKNTVASKIAYNGTHISVHVDLTGTGEYRKCIVEKLTMREGAPVYLGVSAETTVGQIQETQEVLGIEVKGVQDWSRPAPPQVNVAQGYQQQQAAYQAPPQAAYQAPPQAYAPPQAAYYAPAQQVSGDKWAADSESNTVHDKLDLLVKASSALESGSMGNALKELEANVMKHTSGATKALFNRLQKLESIAASISGTSAQVDGLLKLMESSKASIDAGRVDAERRTNELSAKLAEMSTEMASMKEQLEKSSRTTMSMIDRRIRDSQYNLSQSLKGASGGISTWLYFAVFQCMFVAFLLYRHMANKKLDKLL
jgi:hypothetical protein